MVIRADNISGNLEDLKKGSYVIALINEIKGIILGIQVLKMSDEEYEARKGTISSGVPS